MALERGEQPLTRVSANSARAYTQCKRILLPRFSLYFTSKERIPCRDCAKNPLCCFGLLAASSVTKPCSSRRLSTCQEQAKGCSKIWDRVTQHAGRGSRQQRRLPRDQPRHTASNPWASNCAEAEEDLSCQSRSCHSRTHGNGVVIYDPLRASPRFKVSQAKGVYG